MLAPSADMKVFDVSGILTGPSFSKFQPCAASIGGSAASREPGIHNSICRAWIPGTPRSWRPGMPAKGIGDEGSNRPGFKKSIGYRAVVTG